MTQKETTTMNRWNMGVILALGLQVLAFGYWGGQLQSELKTLKVQLEDKSEENLRQWSRINKNEDAIQGTASTQRITTAILSRVEAALDRLQMDVKENNRLLRENGNHSEKN